MKIWEFLDLPITRKFTALWWPSAHRIRSAFSCAAFLDGGITRTKYGAFVCFLDSFCCIAISS